MKHTAKTNLPGIFLPNQPNEKHNLYIGDDYMITCTKSLGEYSGRCIHDLNLLG